MAQDTLTLREAAEELGVHYMTVYRYVRLGLLPARKSGAAWRVARCDLDRFTHPDQPRTPRRQAPWSWRLEQRMLAADQAGAWQVVEAALAAGTTPARVHTEVIGPALRDIGRRWEAGELAVSDEHIATAIAHRLIARLGPMFARRGRSRGTVLATTPPGERHQLGVEMLADILRGAGYEVVVLGVDVPLDSLAPVAEKLDRLVAACVSVVALEEETTVRETVGAIRRVAPGVPVLVGGPRIRDANHAGDLGADGWAADGIGAVAELHRLVDR